MYSYLNIEIISSICDDNLWVSINHDEDGQQARHRHCYALIYLGNLCVGRKGPRVRSEPSCCYKRWRSIEICHLTIIIPTNNMNKVLSWSILTRTQHD